AGAVDLDRGDVVGDVRHLPRPGVGHQLMIGGVVGDVAGVGVLLQAAESVFESRCPGNGPGTREGLEFAQIGEEAVVGVADGGERYRDVGQVLDVGEPPRLRAVGDVV